MFRKKTTDEMIEEAITNLSEEVSILNDRKTRALSIFSTTATRLQDVNTELEENVSKLENLMKFAMSQRNAAQTIIDENNETRNRIMAIIGN